MSERALYALLGVLLALLVAANVAIKPGFDPGQVGHLTRMFGGATDWRDRVAPDFEVALRDGSTFRLADHVGSKVVVLNFFATWCVPCRAEMPELQRYADRMAAAAQPFVIVAVDAQERPDQVDAFVRDLGLRMAVAIDGDGRILGQYDVTAFPTTVVVGADGRIKLYETGAIFNADVAFSPVLPAELAAIGEGRGITREAYLDAAAQAPGLKASAPAGAADAGGAGAADAALTGRALSIAEAMPCPCGCSDRVVACGCQTAAAIKARLRQGIDDTLTDGEVMERLNAEFCMRGM